MLKNKFFITEKNIEEYVQHLKNEERAASTVEKYQSIIRKFADFLDGTEITKEAAIKWENKLLETLAATSVNIMLAAINGFFEFIAVPIKMKLLKIQRNPFLSKEKELTQKEYKRLLETAKNQGNERIYNVLQTICSTGIRVSELKFITVEAVKSEYAEVRNKGKIRVIFIPRDLKRILLKYAKTHGITSGSIFVTKNGKPLDRSNILITILVAVSAVTGFISNTATMAIFLPLTASIIELKGGLISKKNSYMAVGIASIVGGNLTLSGSTPQLIVQGILSQTENCTTLEYFDLWKVTVPLVIIMLLYYLTIGYAMQNKVFNFDEKNDENFLSRNAEKKISRKHIICLIIMTLCIVGFVSNIFSMGSIAISGAVMCIITKSISLKRIMKTIEWQVIMVLVGFLTISKGLINAGLLETITNYIVKLLDYNVSPFMIFAILLLITTIASNFISSTAVAAVLAPISIAIALRLDSNPTTFAIATIIGSNLCFATPISTPPMTMTLIGGYRFSDYVIVGGLFNIIAFFVALFIIPLLYGI